MRKTVARILLCLGLLLMSSTGCIGTVVHLQSAPLEEVGSSKWRTITGHASGFQLFLLIPLNIHNRHARAYERLLHEAGSDCIADIRIQEKWKYAFIGTVYSTTFIAKAYPRQTTGAIQGNLTERLEELQRLKDRGSISEEEYNKLRQKVVDSGGQ
jgi:hypothetical protein